MSWLDDNQALVHDLNLSGSAVRLVFTALVLVIVGLGGYCWGEDAAIERLQQRQRDLACREQALAVAIGSSDADGCSARVRP